MHAATTLLLTLRCMHSDGDSIVGCMHMCVHVSVRVHDFYTLVYNRQ